MSIAAAAVSAVTASFQPTSGAARAQLGLERKATSGLGVVPGSLRPRRETFRVGKGAIAPGLSELAVTDVGEPAAHTA